ncbi:MAG: proteasome subunit beta [Actinobacteria bacterium]|nr:proteasome subunit beta [Actinomycetota bacterium]
MALPIFSPVNDPGPDFAALLRGIRLGGGGDAGIAGSDAGAITRDHVDPVSPAAGGFPVYPSLDPARSFDKHMRHGTTVLALRYSDGVVVAGDRRATEGHLVAYRTMDKVLRVDDYSAVAIAGTAGPAIEMVRLFSTQLEHYEKVEGVTLSIEGKANQLGQMVRDHLAMAMRGMVVVPLFAGYDTLSGSGQIYTFDVTGGHYIEDEFAAEGSGSRFAKSVLKAGWRAGITKAEALDLAIDAIVDAADEDIATGAPDTLRGIYPTVATVTQSGYQAVGDDEIASRVSVLYDKLRSRSEYRVGRSSR